MLVADLHHFLDLPDDVPGPARRLAEQLGTIVRAATAGDAGAAWETALPCRRRPARRACPGRMIVARPPEGPIRWQCSACGDEGVISNWEDTPYDLRRRGLTVAPAATEIVIPDQVAAALRDLQLLDPDCERIVFSIRAHGDRTVLTATAADLDELIGGPPRPTTRPTAPDNNASTPPSTPSPAPPTPCPGDRRTLARPHRRGDGGHSGFATVAFVSNASSSRFHPVPGLAGEFGALASRSGRLLNEVSHAQIIGAQNLLTKATHSVSAGDAQRAEQLIDRAAQMPYDPREEGSPGVRAASVLVYSLIVDQFDASEPDDMTWLDVILAVHPHLDPTGQAEVASVVHGFVLQSAFFTVTPAESRQIQQSFGDAPLEPHRGDEPDTTVEQRRRIIRSLVMATSALADAYTDPADAG